MPMKFKLKDHGYLPIKARHDDAGWDIYLPADVKIGKGITIIPTGVCVQLPHGYAGLLAIRSSVAKTGLVLQNPLIDENYRGEIHAIVANFTDEEFEYKEKERICSLYVFPLYLGSVYCVDELDPSNRGEAWSGSSGR